MNKKLFLGRYFGFQDPSPDLGGGGRNHKRQQQPTIKEYLPTLMCLVCGKELSPLSSSHGIRQHSAGYLCVTCSSLPYAPAAACNSLTSRLNYLDRMENDRRIICRCCCGWSQIEDPPLFPRGSKDSRGTTSIGMGHQGTVLVGKECCVSTDCPVLYERVRNLSKREDVSLSLLALSLTDR
jgi:hypothetical protein